MLALMATAAFAADARLVVEADVGHTRSAWGELAGEPTLGAAYGQRYAGAAVGVEYGRLGVTVGGDLDGAPDTDGLDREIRGVTAQARIVVVRMPSLVVRTLGDADVAVAVGPAWRWRSTPERSSCTEELQAPEQPRWYCVEADRNARCARDLFDEYVSDGRRYARDAAVRSAQRRLSGA